MAHPYPLAWAEKIFKAFRAVHPRAYEPLRHVDEIWAEQRQFPLCTPLDALLAAMRRPDRRSQDAWILFKEAVRVLDDAERYFGVIRMLSTELLYGCTLFIDGNCQQALDLYGYRD